MVEIIQIRVAIAIDKRGNWTTFSEDWRGSAEPGDDGHAMGHARQDLAEREQIPVEEIETFMLTTERQINYIICPDCSGAAVFCRTCGDNGRIFQ